MSIFLFYFWKSFDELKTNEMVTDNYYEKELVYGEVLAKKKNADTMRVQVQIIKDTDGLRISFPKYITDMKGKINLYKPDNSKLDQEFTIRLDSNYNFKIPKDKYIPGRWDIFIDWESNNVLYFIEKKLNL
jgi:dynactin complex subunit